MACLLYTSILFLLGEQPEQELSFFYTAAALSHIYRFIVSYQIECGAFSFRAPAGAAFFPGTFDPFSLSHKGIVQAIRNLGMEVYLAVDEFSWSKKTQPSLVRRQIVSMSVADEFDVYLFPPVSYTHLSREIRNLAERLLHTEEANAAQMKSFL